MWIYKKKSVGQNSSSALERMTINNPEVSSLLPDGEIDLREVLAAFRRRWIWVASGGLLGLGIAAGILMSRPLVDKPLKALRMMVDTSQGPCFWTSRKFQRFESGEVLRMQCFGEFSSTRKYLATLVSGEFGPNNEISAKVRPLTFGNKKDKSLVDSNTHIEVLVEANVGELDVAKAKLANIKNEFVTYQLDNIGMLVDDVQVGKGWISIESDPVVDQSKSKSKSKSFNRFLVLGLLGGLVTGSGAALIADRRSNRVFSRSKLLEQLGYPLWLSLPTLPWSDQVAGPLVGQLAARLDRSLDWRVLSIAREHEAVGSLAQALSRQNEPELSCKAVAPLLNSIIRLGSNSRPIGLLVVVESGFNSSQALEDARLLLSQLSCVQSIGVVLVGVPLPSELTEAEKA